MWYSSSAITLPTTFCLIISRGTAENVPTPGCGAGIFSATLTAIAAWAAWAAVSNGGREVVLRWAA